MCGNSAVVIGGKDFKMPFHGFASKSVFSVENVKPDGVTFVLFYDEETLKVYPFKFRLSIKYTVCGNTLFIENVVENLGEGFMYYAIGRHDSFLLNGATGDHKLCFEKEKEFLSQKTDKKANLINLFVDFGEGKELCLPEDFLADGRTLIFGKVASRQVTIKTLDNRPIAALFYPDVDNILFWRPNGADMICIEPWSALPDDADEFVAFDKDKKYFSIGEKEKKTVDFQITYY